MDAGAYAQCTLPGLWVRTPRPARACLGNLVGLGARDDHMLQVRAAAPADAEGYPSSETKRSAAELMQ